MKTAPYSLQDAQQLCADYQYLLGQSFAGNSKLIVDCVTIAPFDEAAKQRFLIMYFLLNNAESALADENNGPAYDVLVMGRSSIDEHELEQEDLNTWLATNKSMHDQNPEKARQ